MPTCLLRDRRSRAGTTLWLRTTRCARARSQPGTSPRRRLQGAAVRRSPRLDRPRHVGPRCSHARAERTGTDGLLLLPSADAAAVREQSKRVIAELLSYGVPPAYLLSIGISPLTLSASFHDLDLDVALPAAPDAASSPVLPYHDRAPDVVARSAAQSLEPAPAPAALDLAALEARKREELLARKAALLARNRLHAQSLETELDSLFSSTPATSSLDESSPATSSRLPASEEPAAVVAVQQASGPKKRPQKRARKKRRLDALAEPFAPDTTRAVQATSPPLTAQAVHDLRESIDHTEEVVNTPQGGPFASEDLQASASLAASSSHLAARSSHRTRTRPIATEFEHDPTVRLSSNSLMRGRTGRAFIAEEPVRMIIEISDDEDDSDEDGQQRGGQSPVATDPHRHPARLAREGHESSGSGEPENPPPRSTGPLPLDAPADADPKEAERRRQLLEKESAIRKMMNRIAEIERRKKELGKGRPSDSASMSRSASTDAVQVGQSTPPPSMTIPAADASEEDATSVQVTTETFSLAAYLS